MIAIYCCRAGRRALLEASVWLREEAAFHRSVIRTGQAEVADGGPVLFDEIGDMIYMPKRNSSRLGTKRKVYRWGARRSCSRIHPNHGCDPIRDGAPDVEERVSSKTCIFASKSCVDSPIRYHFGSGGDEITLLIDYYLEKFSARFGRETGRGSARKRMQLYYTTNGRVILGTDELDGRESKIDTHS